MQNNKNLNEKNIIESVAYEVRSSVNAITGMTEIARGQLDNREQIEQCLETIDVASNHLIQIVDDAFALSAMKFGNIRLDKDVFSLEDILAQLENQAFLEARRRDVEFILERKFEENLLYGDAARLYQVMMYLIGNAMEHTAQGRTVRVLVEQKNHARQKVTFFFEIQANVEGIFEGNEKKVFVAYDDSRWAGKSRERHYGGGLEITVCHHLIQMMGGKLEVESEPNRGSSFSFTLDLRVPPKDYVAQFWNRSAEEENTIDLKGKIVLLAEDNKVSVQIVKRLLEMQGASVWIAENGEECLKQYWQSGIGEIAFILMDINMPKVNGLEAAQDIRASDRKDSQSIPIIAMTANAFDEDVEESLAAGMDAHIAKPIQIKTLLEEIAAAVSSKKQNR